MRPALIVFARPPRIGRVKRRLARDIGALAATVWYRRALAVLLRRVGRDPRWRPILAVPPGPDRALPALPAGWSLTRQAHGDLGRRMAHALAACRPGPAVLVGSDVPALGSRHVATALRALGSASIVLGPATDGGFWLIGLRRPDRAQHLFRAVRWSTPHALSDVLANLDGRDRVALLAPLRDVDTGPDLAVVSGAPVSG